MRYNADKHPFYARSYEQIARELKPRGINLTPQGVCLICRRAEQKIARKLVREYGGGK